MQQAESIKAEYVHEFRSEIWEGFVFVTLSVEITPK